MNRLEANDYEILQALWAGKTSNRQLEAALHLTESAIKQRLTLLYRKLDVRDRCQLILWAVMNGVPVTFRHDTSMLQSIRNQLEVLIFRIDHEKHK